MTESLETDEMRPVVRRALQLMNQYGLRELEFEDKDGEQVLSLSRDSSESFPPLLEGRSADVTGKLRAPSVGRLRWEVADGDEVERGDLLGEIEKTEDVLEITAPCSGIITDPIEEQFVEYGQHLGSVLTQSDRDEMLAEEVDADEEDSE